MRTLQLLQAEYPYVERAFGYNDRDTAVGTTHQRSYGLRRQDASKKPAWDAVANYLSEHPSAR